MKPFFYGEKWKKNDGSVQGPSQKAVDIILHGFADSFFGYEKRFALQQAAYSFIFILSILVKNRKVKIRDPQYAYGR